MALDDFYDWTPTGITNFIMLAGSSQTVTDFDIWMMRDFWRHLSSRYVTPDAAAPVATTSSIRATSAVTTSVPPTLAFSTASVATTLKTTIKTTITTLATSIKTTTKVASTAAPTTLKTTTVAVRTTSSPLPAATGGVGAPLYGQCGGNGWAGPRTCVSGTCKFNNDWYSKYFHGCVEKKRC